MDGFVQWMEKHFMPKASVIAAQRHLVAIRDAFVVTMHQFGKALVATFGTVHSQSLPF